MIVARRWKLLYIMLSIWPALLTFLVWDVAITVLFIEFNQTWISLEALPTSLIGTAVAVLITIRNNIAYARWWEARQLWGGVVNHSRSLGRQVRLFLPDAAIATALVQLQVAYVHALRCHLRKKQPWTRIDDFVAPDVLARLRGSSNVPNALLCEIADQLAALGRAGTLDTVALAAFDTTLTALANMQGGAERIKNTPLSRQYSMFPNVFVHVFCLLLPLAMVSNLRLMTPLGSTLIGLLFLLLDRVGADLENPFENSVHDVPLTAITRTIEINLRETLGQSDLPPPLQPRGGVLW